MPYIKGEDKKDVRVNGPSTAGELNFALSQNVNDFLQTSQFNYQAFNDVIGALENLKFEIQRRFLAPYEDKKIEENGDAFNFEFYQRVQ